jgi:hypothetical protein
VGGGFYLFIAFFFGLAGGYVGKAKGSSFFIWFLISGLIPFLGLLVALLYRVERDEPQRACPGCGKVVPLYQALCTRCGTELEYYPGETEVLPPRSAVG